MQFVWFALVGLVAGWLAGQLMKGGGFGVVGDIVVGVLGALLGGFLFSSLGLSSGGGLLGAIIVATIGAVVLIFILRLVKRAKFCVRHASPLTAERRRSAHKLPLTLPGSLPESCARGGVTRTSAFFVEVL